METRNCRHCGTPVIPYPGKPGYIDECLDCATDVERVRASQSENDDGSAFAIERKPLSRGSLAGLAAA